jgi:hypothetical protein
LESRPLTILLEKGKGHYHSSPINISDKNTEESSEEEVFMPLPGARKPGSKPNLRLEEDESGSGSESESDDKNTVNSEDFIVEDEGDVQVVLPDQFSNLAAQPEERAFKVLFQLFVHVACQPAELRKEYMKARLKGELGVVHFILLLFCTKSF